MKIDVRMTPNELQNLADTVREAGDERNYRVYDDDVFTELLEIVDAALISMGINIVEDEDDDDEPNEMEFDCEGDCANCENPWPEDEDEDEDEEEEEEEEETSTDTTQYAITPKGMFVLGLAESGVPFELAMTIADSIFKE